MSEWDKIRVLHLGPFYALVGLDYLWRPRLKSRFDNPKWWDIKCGIFEFSYCPAPPADGE